MLGGYSSHSSTISIVQNQEQGQQQEHMGKAITSHSSTRIRVIISTSRDSSTRMNSAISSEGQGQQQEHKGDIFISYGRTTIRATSSAGTTVQATPNKSSQQRHERNPHLAAAV